MGDNQLLPMKVLNVLEMQIMRLNLWSLKINDKGVKVEGFVRSDDGTIMQKQSSEFICKRMGTNMLLDISGRFVELLGQIDKSFHFQQGFPNDLVEKFSNGFPENWSLIINEFMNKNSSQNHTKTVAIYEKQSEPIVTLAEDTHFEQRNVEKNERRDNINDTVTDDSLVYETTLRGSKLNSQATPVQCYRKLPELKKFVNNRVFDSPCAQSTPVFKKPESRVLRESDRNVVESCNSIMGSESQTEGSSKNNAALDDIGMFFSDFTVNKTPNIEHLKQSRIHRENDEMRNENNRAPMNHHMRQRRSDDYDSRIYQNESRYEDFERRRRSSPPRYREDRIPESRNSTRYDNLPRKYYERPDRRDYRRKDEDDYDEYPHTRQNRDYYDSSYEAKRPRLTKEHRRDYNGMQGYRRETCSDSIEDIIRQEKLIENRLKIAKERRKKSNRSAPSSSQSDEEVDRELKKQWDIENAMDYSMVMDIAELNWKKHLKRDQKMLQKKANIEPPKSKAKPKPKPKVKPRSKKIVVDTAEDDEEDELNTSIAQRKGTRSCLRTNPYAPKKLILNRATTEKLKRILELKNPSNDEKDWLEVRRLLGKEDIEIEEIKKAAFNRIKWKRKEAEEQAAATLEEDLEVRKRRGVNKSVREDLLMRNHMLNNNGKKADCVPVEDAEVAIGPADISADESLLNIPTPVAKNHRGGKRASFVPNAIEDTPQSSKSSRFNIDDTKTDEEIERMKYAKHLVDMNSASYYEAAGKKPTRRTKNTKRLNYTVDEAFAKANKMIMNSTNMNDGSDDNDTSVFHHDDIIEVDEEDLSSC